MEFKEFSEFPNPEEADYDITSSLHDEEVVKTPTKENPYLIELINLIGFLEDFTEEELMEEYNITEREYFSPDATTIKKVQAKMAERGEKPLIR